MQLCYLKTLLQEPDLVEQAWNPSPLEVEPGGLFEASLSYLERRCYKQISVGESSSLSG